MIMYKSYKQENYTTLNRGVTPRFFIYLSLYIAKYVNSCYNELKYLCNFTGEEK